MAGAQHAVVVVGKGGATRLRQGHPWVFRTDVRDAPPGELDHPFVTVLDERKNPVAVSAASITAGRALYNKNCRHCHGLRAKGDGPLAPKNPKPADLTDAHWDHGASDGEIFAVIWNGAPAPNSEMKPMKGTLTEKNVWEIVNYLRSIGPTPAAKAAKK